MGRTIIVAGHERCIKPAKRQQPIFDLADELERATGYPVDVRVINDAPLPYRYNVSRGHKLVARDEESYYTFLERTRSAWWDFEPVALAYLREMAS